MKNFDRQGLKEDLTAGEMSLTAVAHKYGISKQLINYYKQIYCSDTKSKRKVKTQLEKDIGRIQRKDKRSEDRASNLLRVLMSDVLDELSKPFPDSDIPSPKQEVGSTVGLIQISDTHFGENVILPYNYFDLITAQERLYSHVYRSARLFKNQGIKDVVVVFSGDLINSDRRYDELLTNTPNRASSLVGFFRWAQVALKGLAKDFNIVDVHSVVGNESRINLDLSTIPSLATNNFDYILHEMLHASLPHLVKNPIREDEASEKVIEVLGHKILITHGINFRADDVFNVVPRYAREVHKDIDFTLCGHIHEAIITGDVGRSGGLAGGNDYSRSLKIFNTKAQQNCYIITEDSIQGVIHELKE